MRQKLCLFYWIRKYSHNSKMQLKQIMIYKLIILTKKLRLKYKDFKKI